MRNFVTVHYLLPMVGVLGAMGIVACSDDEDGQLRSALPERVGRGGTSGSAAGRGRGGSAELPARRRRQEAAGAAGSAGRRKRAGSAGMSGGRHRWNCRHRRATDGGIDRWARSFPQRHLR